MSVGVDLWGPADEPTLMDETPPQWQAPVQSLTASFLEKDSVESALWRVGLAGTSTDRVDP